MSSLLFFVRYFIASSPDQPTQKLQVVLSNQAAMTNSLQKASCCVWRRNKAYVTEFYVVIAYRNALELKSNPDYAGFFLLRSPVRLSLHASQQ